MSNPAARQIDNILSVKDSKRVTRTINERVAVVEAEQATLREAISEIKAAVIVISEATRQMAVLDRQIVDLIDSHKELRRSLEAERDTRQSADSLLAGRVGALESSTGLNGWRLDTLGQWALRIGAGIVLMSAGYLLSLVAGLA